MLKKTAISQVTLKVLALTSIHQELPTMLVQMEMRKFLLPRLIQEETSNGHIVLAQAPLIKDAESK